MDETLKRETLAFVKTDKQLLSLSDGSPIHGKLTAIDSKVLGQGRDSRVYKALLKIGNNEFPAVVKESIREQKNDAITFQELEEIRVILEKENDFSLAYIYGKTEDGLTVQEYISGKTLEKKLYEDPDFLDDAKRVELVNMALNLGSVVDEVTKGKYILKGLSADDILVAESDDQVKVKTKGKLICIDPSIHPTLNNGLRESSNLQYEANMFTTMLFDSVNKFDGTDFTFKYKYKDKDEEWHINSIEACFVKKPVDSTQSARSRFDLELHDKNEALQRFIVFCVKNEIRNSKLVKFLFELYYSENVRVFGKNDQALKPIFSRDTKVQDFKKYYDSLTG